jgi:hypothetical protein
MKYIFPLFPLAFVSLLSISGIASPCPAGTQDGGWFQNKKACILSGTYTTNLELTSDNIWMLRGGVFIGKNNAQRADLKIQPGTKIVGYADKDYLVITRGSRILAEGTQFQPIVFTAGAETGRRRGMWGGLVINGNAPINSCRPKPGICEAEGEGSTGLYGGNDPHDNSGVLRYVRVEWAGYQITPENEFNGIAFQGVGDGTVVDYLQLHMNADDGMEFFGGTVNVKHVVSTGNGDDALDWTSGWSGKAQFGLLNVIGDDGNNGIEADNLEAYHNADPRSIPMLSNFTVLGAATGAGKGGDGVLLRRGTGGHFVNFIISGAKKSCLNLDDAATFEQADAGNLTVANSMVSCQNTKPFAAKTETDPWEIQGWFLGGEGNQVVDPRLDGNVPAADSSAIGAGVTPDHPFFAEVDFVGAIRDGAHDWTRGWTTDAQE